MATPGTTSRFTLEEQIKAVNRAIGFARQRHGFARMNRRLTKEQFASSEANIEALEAAAGTLNELYLLNHPTLF